MFSSASHRLSPRPGREPLIHDHRGGLLICPKQALISPICSGHLVTVLLETSEFKSLIGSYTEEVGSVNVRAKIPRLPGRLLPLHGDEACWKENPGRGKSTVISESRFRCLDQR